MLNPRRRGSDPVGRWCSFGVIDVVPDDLRKRLSLHGEQDATIVMTRVAGKGTCLLVRPF